MLHRSPTWWRALGVVLLGLATVTWPSASGADSTPGVTVEHQDATVNLTNGSTSMGLRLALSPTSAPARATVTLYPALVTRGALEEAVAGGDAAAPLATTGSFPLDCEQKGVANITIAVDVTGKPGATGRCGAATPRVHLNCASGGCNGVFPLHLSVTVGGTTITEWSLLALRTQSVYQPLRVIAIADVGPAALQHPERSRRDLDELARYTTVPLTMSADFATLNSMSTGTSTSAWQRSLEDVLDSSLHQAVVAVPGSIDLAGLAANGLAGQVDQQLALPANLFSHLTDRSVDAPVFVRGAPSAPDVAALAAVGTRDVVLSENALTSAPSQTLTWGTPFHVDGSTSTTALATDGPLSHLLDDTSMEPGRRAAVAIGTMAFLHFEAPNAPSPKSLVLVDAVGTTSPTFLRDLLSALSTDPFATASPLTNAFSATDIGVDGSPTTRALRPRPASSWTVHNVTSLLSLIGAVNSFAGSVGSVPAVLALRSSVAATEVRSSPVSRQSAIDTTTTTLDEHLGGLTLDDSPITLAGTGTSLPITLHSTLPYPVHAVVHLVTSRLDFSKGADVAVTITGPTDAIRVPIAASHTSSLTLQVVVTTPNGELDLTRAAIPVRIAGTSIVGYLLTAASLLVLLLWWARTLRRGKQGRHAR